MFGIVVGSNTATSRQLRIFFPVEDTDNIMEGFALFEKGFTLEDSITTCSFDAFFPVSGDVILSGGTLTLLRDIELKKPFSIGPGTIDANGYAIEFPGNFSSIDIPTKYHTDLFLDIETKDAVTEIESVHWSYDDKYLVVGSRIADGHDELQIYYFDGSSLTSTLSLYIGENIFTARWHPSDYYLAIGHSAGGDELDIYYLNVASGTLELKGSDNTGRVNALAWDPTGNYLAVGRNNDPDFYVYEVSDGVPGTFYSATYSSFPAIDRSVQKSSIDWDYTSSYIAVGLDFSDADAELKVFYFSGSALSENAEEITGSDVYSVKWMPLSSTLAISQDLGFNRFQLYNHDSVQGTLTEIISAQVDDGQTIFGVDWSYDGRFLGIVKKTTDSTHELRVFCFDTDENKLSLVSGSKNSFNINCIAWTNSGYNFVTGDIEGNLQLFGPTVFPLRFKNARLFFNSDVTFRGPVIFEGNCVINGGGNAFNFVDEGSISIANGSSLILEDARIKNLSANKSACLDNDGLLFLSDIDWFQDSSYTFSVGALQLENDIVMSGDSTFVYASSKTSTLLAKSQLYL
ncbi:MAG: hypothetical protein KAR20_03595, partial [Candidatus Heimdallarchaeota archaeon]|nr:hypothetical protein [Candidatus Heimdallarchaeota archaeon]